MSKACRETGGGLRGTGAKYASFWRERQSGRFVTATRAQRSWLRRAASREPTHPAPRISTGPPGSSGNEPGAKGAAPRSPPRTRGWASSPSSRIDAPKQSSSSADPL